MLPPDHHVHTEWSYDAPGGSMEQACARAVQLGLPSIAFTDHADLVSWEQPDGSDLLVPPTLDVSGYLASLERCRTLFPGLRILSGIELAEPHWSPEIAASLLAEGQFDRVLCSVHSRRIEPGRYLELPSAYEVAPGRTVVADYLAEIESMVASWPDMHVVTHVDYPLRYWPRSAGPFAITDFEGEFRSALRAVAGRGLILELNTRAIVYPELPRWWHDAGGAALSFGSDAHTPEAVAREFPQAAQLAEACGFRPSARPHDPWVRA